MSFVKSKDTSTSVPNSKSQLDKMLRRYGAKAISMGEDLTKKEIIVRFVVPDSTRKDAHDVPVALPVNVYAVYDALYGRPWRTVWENDLPRKVTDANCYDTKKLDQAERVAWRNVCLWVDAALSAAGVGIQTITEAFFAHAVVGDGGKRMIDVVEEYQSQLGGGVQRLLTSTTEST